MSLTRCFPDFLKAISFLGTEFQPHKFRAVKGTKPLQKKEEEKKDKQFCVQKPKYPLVFPLIGLYANFTSHVLLK